MASFRPFRPAPGNPEPASPDPDRTRRPRTILSRSGRAACIVGRVWFDRRFSHEPPFLPDRVSRPIFRIVGRVVITGGRLNGPRRASTRK